MALLDVKNVRKVYTTRFGGNQVEALKDVNFSVEQGEYVAIRKRFKQSKRKRDGGISPE